MRRTAHSSEKIPFDPEPERTLRKTRKLLKEIAETSTLEDLDPTLEILETDEENDLQASSPPPYSPPRQPPLVTMSKMSTHNMPTAESVPKGSTFPEGIPGTFDLKPGFLHLIEKNQFGGGANEDPAAHIRNFIDYCGTVKHQSVTQDQIRDMYFRFSLRDDAREWITDLDREAEGITDWNSLALAFYQKYFPPEKTNMLRSQITSFKQHATEDLSEAWDRFKKVVKACPHHSFQQWFLVLQFHNGLFNESRGILDTAAGGRFASNVNDNEAWKIIEDMANHTKQYGRPRNNKPSSIYEKSAVNSVSASSIGAQVATAVAAEMASLHASLNKRFDAIEIKVGQGGSYPVYSSTQEAEICDMCGLEGHHVGECQASQETVNYFQDWKEKNSHGPNPPPQPKPTPTPYIPPHRSYPPRDNTYTRQPYQLPPNQPPIPRNNFQPAPSSSQPQEGPSMSEFEALKAQMAELMAYNKMIEAQLVQASGTRQPGTLPSQGKSPHETLNAITLRSSTTYGGLSVPTKEVEGEETRKESEKELSNTHPGGLRPHPAGSGPIRADQVSSGRMAPRSKVRSQEQISSGRMESHPGGSLPIWTDEGPSGRMEPRIAAESIPKVNHSIFGPEVPILPPRLPFPGRQREKSPLETHLAKFKEVISKLNVTMPFLDLVMQVPAYTKYLKQILSRKSSLNAVESVAFTEECSALLQSNHPPKLSDPGSFSIPCAIGTHDVHGALCDLGASVSVMPLSLAKKLGMTKFKCTTMTIQLADRSLAQPLGILEDVPVRVGKFFIPVDFVVLDIAEDSHIPIILGRPFLHTAGAKIDVGTMTLIFKVGGDEISFTQSRVPKAPMLEVVGCALTAPTVVESPPPSKDNATDIISCEGLFAGNVYVMQVGDTEATCSKGAKVKLGEKHKARKGLAHVLDMKSTLPPENGKNRDHIGTVPRETQWLASLHRRGDPG